MVAPFILIVADHGRKQFTAEGPMMDDRPWNEAVGRAQTAGRDVNCSTVPGTDVEAAAEAYAKQFEYRRREPGTIASIYANLGQKELLEAFDRTQKALQDERKRLSDIVDSGASLQSRTWAKVADGSARIIARVEQDLADITAAYDQTQKN